MTNEFNPDWSCPPADSVLDILKERNCPVNLFMKDMGWNENELQEFLSGKMRINLELAVKLRDTLGSSEAFWINRDTQYVNSRLQQLEKSTSEHFVVTLKEREIEALYNMCQELDLTPQALLKFSFIQYQTQHEYRLRPVRPLPPKMKE